MARKHVLAIINNFHFALFTWFNGRFGVRGDSAATASRGLVDDKGGLSCIGKGEGAFLNRVLFTESTKVTNFFISLSFNNNERRAKVPPYPALVVHKAQPNWQN